MRVLLSTTPSVGRYPRWGYLDKFGVNPYMARAFFAVVALQLVVWSAVATWSAFQSERQVTGPWVTPRGRVHPQPPPSIIPPGKRAPRQPVGRIPPPQHAKVVPAPMADEEIEFLEPAPQNGAGSGDGAPGVGGSGDDPFGGRTRFEPVAATASPDIFVAFEKAPELVRMEAPEYPDLARAAGVEGRVNVLVRVGVDGFVSEARLAGDGVPMLNEAALGAARTAVFKPALQADRPVQAWIVIPIEFDLRR